MRGLIQTQAKALLFSLSAVGFLLVATSFYYDGPLAMTDIEPTAQATEPALPTTKTIASASPAQKVRKPLEGLLPAAFSNAWQQIVMDDGRVHLQVLNKPLLLSHTRHQAGSEAFDYASFLFEQIAKDIKSNALAEQVKSLSMQAQTMGNAVRQASDFRYDGPPSEDMAHLQVRSNILFYLQGLNRNALITAQYNQDGKLMSESPATKTLPSGEDLKTFLAKADSILNMPEAKQYPDAMKLIRQESDLLRNLATHLTLRWESTMYCQGSCDTMATYVRVYTHQTLPEKTPATIIF